MEKLKYKLEKGWNISRAEYEYVLYQGYKSTGEYIIFAGDDGYTYDKLGSGDAEWAKRTAEYFGIEINENDTLS